MAKELVLVGASAFAEIAYEYFTHDSDYHVAGFAVESEFLEKKELCGLPVVPLEEVERDFPPSSHHAFTAITYGQLNGLRTRLYNYTKAKGYPMASYLSSRAFIWRNVKIGENCFVFENNVIQPFVTVGDNVILWSGNHIGHHSRIGDGCFLSSHVVVSGFCEIGERTFIGVNATLVNNISIGQRTIVGAGAVVRKSMPDAKLVVGDPAKPLRNVDDRMI